MGVTYAQLDGYMAGETIPEEKAQIVKRLHDRSEHKRKGSAVFGE